MKINLSEHNLSSIFNYEEMKKMFMCFSNITHIDVSLHDNDGNEQISYRVNEDNCICELIKNNDIDNSCKNRMRYAAIKAAELGEPYIYNCGCLIKCSAPIIFEEKLIGSVALGPVLLWEPDEQTTADIKSFLSLRSIPDEIIDNLISNVKQLSCDNMTSAAQMLFVIVNYISQEESKHLQENKKISIQQRQIADLLIDKKNNKDKNSRLKKYSVDMEKELIAYVQAGDNKNAKRMLNDILGEIFSYTSGNLDIIKAKLYELTAILMRAAVDIGAPLEKLSEYINYYTKILADSTTFEDLCFMTSEIMEVFISIVYECRALKHENKHLVKAINYIKHNYSEQLSLKSVANNIYLNNYYLSHLFRSEMNMTFSDYLNKIRMEESIALMKSSNMKVQEIAEAVGYRDANYFTKAFKKYYSMTPKKYMNMHKITL